MSPKTLVRRGARRPRRHRRHAAPLRRRLDLNDGDLLASALTLEASSGRVVRHRLNRHGDRQLNRALPTIATSRMHYHDETKTYRDRRIAEGRSDYEIRRCLKRSISRALYRLMQRTLASEDRRAESPLSPRT